MNFWILLLNKRQSIFFSDSFKDGLKTLILNRITDEYERYVKHKTPRVSSIYLYDKIFNKIQEVLFAKNPEKLESFLRQVQDLEKEALNSLIQRYIEKMMIDGISDFYTDVIWFMRKKYSYVEELIKEYIDVLKVILAEHIAKRGWHNREIETFLHFFILFDEQSEDYLQTKEIRESMVEFIKNKPANFAEQILDKDNLEFLISYFFGKDEKKFANFIEENNLLPFVVNAIKKKDTLYDDGTFLRSLYTLMKIIPQLKHDKEIIEKIISYLIKTDDNVYDIVLLNKITFHTPELKSAILNNKKVSRKIMNATISLFSGRSANTASYFLRFVLNDKRCVQTIDLEDRCHYFSDFIVNQYFTGDKEELRSIFYILFPDYNEKHTAIEYIISDYVMYKHIYEDEDHLGSVEYFLKTFSEFARADLDTQISKKYKHVVKKELLRNIMQSRYDKYILYSLVKNKNSILQSFDISEHEWRIIVFTAFLQLLEQGYARDAFKLVQNNIVQLTKFEKRAYELFGANMNHRIFSMVLSLEEGHVPNELKELGVTNTGYKGLKEFAYILQSYKYEFTSRNPYILDKPEIVLNYLSGFAHIKEVDYIEDEDQENNKKDGSLTLLQHVAHFVEENKFRPLNAAFYIEREYNISKLESSKKPKYREDFLQKYTSLHEEMHVALKIVLNHKKPISFLVEDLQEKINKIKKKLQEQSQKLQHNSQAQLGIKQRLDILSSINIRSIKDFEQNIITLSRFTELHKSIRQILFAYVFAKHKHIRNNEYLGHVPENITIDHITQTLDFIEHTLKHEVFRSFIKTKEGAKTLEKLMNTSALKNQFILMHSRRQKTGEVSVYFSTHRDLHTELSGYYADACWDKLTPGILTEYPHISSVLFVQDKGTDNEKIVGSCLLIEAERVNGKKVLIIRGLNPRESFINHIDAKEFIDKFISYAKELAIRSGMELAISIDQDTTVGGHTTNRHAISEIITKYKKEGKFSSKPIELDDLDELYFNHYDITESVYLVK